MKDQREKAPTEIPEGVEGSQEIDVMRGLEELIKAGGSTFRSRHHKARQIRKRARIRKRLGVKGVNLQKRNEAHGSKLERKLARRLARQEAA